MKLFSLEIHHFRCISHLHFEWDKSPPILWITGATNTGKSSFCQAILFAFLGKVPDIESSLQLIHWSAPELLIHLRFQHPSGTYRISRRFTRDGQVQFRIWNETEDQELFSEQSLTEKQESFQKRIHLDPQAFLFCFFFSPQYDSDALQYPLTVFRKISHMGDLRAKQEQLTQQTQELLLIRKTAQEELTLAQRILNKLLLPHSEALLKDLEQEKRLLDEQLTQQIHRRARDAEQIAQWEYLQTYLGEYDLHFRHLLKQQLTQQVALLAAPFEDFLENHRIAFKDDLQQSQKQYEAKKDEWKEALFQISKIQEFRNAIQCRLQEVQKYLEDRLVRNPKTPREELCLSLSRVAQLTYVQNEAEDVLRDNKIRNFMFYSISVILMLMIPVFFYLKSLQSTYYRDQLKVQTFGGFIVLLILILMWYFSQKLKNNEILRNYSRYKIRLQEELAHVEQESVLLHKFLYAPVSQIEASAPITPELQQLFRQLLFLAQEGSVRLLETIQNRLPLPELHATHLPAAWDRLEYSKIQGIEDELNRLQEKIQDTEKILTQLRTLEKMLSNISFDYPETFKPRSFSLEHLLEPLQELQQLQSRIKYLERFPLPSVTHLSKIQDVFTSLSGKPLQILNEQPPSENEEQFEHWLKQQKEKLFAQIPCSLNVLKEQIDEVEKQIQETTQQLLNVHAKQALQEERTQIHQLLIQQSEQWKQKQKHLQQQIPQLSHQIKVQETLAELINETLDQMESKMFPALEKMASFYLPLWTKGALGRVQRTASGQILMFCLEKNDFVAWEQLGSGLQQLAHIALYCSISLLLSSASDSETKPFLVLDAPDASLDSATAQDFFQALESVQNHFEQIIITTRAVSREKKWVLPVP